MRKLKSVLSLFGFVAAAVIFAPSQIPAAAPPGESALSEAQQAVLTTALAENNSYAEIVKQALDAGMDGEEVVLVLCQKAGNDPSLVYEIVYAAITGGYDAEKVVSGALRAGARLETVVQAAKAAGASRDALSAAALKNNYSATQIANAFAGTFGDERGRLGGGSVFHPSLGGGSIGGGSLGDGSIGGGGGGNASPYKP